MALWQQVVAASSVTIALALSRVAPEWLLGGQVWKTVPVLFLLQAVAYATYWMVIWPDYVSPLRKLPRVSGGSYLLGQFRTISRDPSGVPMQRWIESVPNDGLLTYRMLFNKERLLITSPKALAEVLVTKSYEFVKPKLLTQGIGEILGIGILLAEGDEHKRQRKNLNPAFAFRHVKDLYPTFWGKGVEMVQAIHAAITTPSAEEEKPTNVVEAGQWTSRATLDIIGLAGMGKDFNAIAAPSNELFQTYKSIFNPSRTDRLLGLLSAFFPRTLLTSLPIKRNSEMSKASKTVKRVAYGLIQNKKKKLAAGLATDSDILSVALSSGGFTDENLVNQLMTFLAAGHETTASSMTWAILQLCRNPAIQTRLRAELRAAGITSPLGADGPPDIVASDIEHVPYLAAVCNEVLRVNPPVALTLREAAEDATILGQAVPAGTTIIMCPLAINQSEELWGPDAKVFNPERWMAEGKANSGGASSNYAFLTFLHGPRSCIGSNFARAEFMCLLAAWVSAFDTVLEDPDKVIEVGGGITNRPKGGLRVKVTPIES